MSFKDSNKTLECKFFYYYSYCFFFFLENDLRVSQKDSLFLTGIFLVFITSNYGTWG